MPPRRLPLASYAQQTVRPADPTSLYGNAVDQILAEENVSELITAPSRVLWNLVDNLGTTRDIARNDASLATHFTFDAFGQVLTGDTTLTRYLYTSREYDVATDLTFYRARYYDAALGRFLSIDPSGFAAGDTNTYRSVGNNAPNATDPSGLKERARRSTSWQRVNNDGSVSFVNPNIDPEVEALLRKRGSAPVTHIHNFSTGVPVARDLADAKLYPYLLPNSPPPAISGPVLRATLDAGMSEITSRNSELPSMVFKDVRKHLIQLDGPWGYRPTGATAPLSYDSRTLAEYRIYDQLAIDNYQLAEGVGTFVLHALPGGAASDYFSQEGIASKQAWMAVAADVGAVATLRGSKYIRIIGMTAEGAVIVMSSVDAARNVADGKYIVAAGDFGQIMLHALILRKGVKLHRSRMGVELRGGLVHMTEAGDAIRGSQRLGLLSDLYAGPASNAGRSGWSLTGRTGLNPTGNFEPIFIPSAAQSAFSRPIPIGPATLWQRATGQQYAARGIINLETGAFTRTGFNQTQARWYAFDTLTTGGGLTAGGLYWWSTTTDDQ